MKVGLVRHFEILVPTSRRFMNSEEFTAWAKDYELRGVSIRAVKVYFAPTRYRKWCLSIQMREKI